MKIAVLVLGILGILLGLIITIGSLVLPAMTRNVSQNEAMPFVIVGALILIVSFFVAVLGLVFVLMKKKKA
jgi:hypothetical protein